LFVRTPEITRPSGPVREAPHDAPAEDPKAPRVFARQRFRPRREDPMRTRCPSTPPALLRRRRRGVTVKAPPVRRGKRTPRWQDTRWVCGSDGSTWDAHRGSIALGRHRQSGPRARATGTRRRDFLSCRAPRRSAIPLLAWLGMRSGSRVRAHSRRESPFAVRRRPPSPSPPCGEELRRPSSKHRTDDKMNE
jgi:hypothetical protein